MKKNFLTVMTCAAILPIFFTCGAFAETTQPPETSKPPSGNIDPALVGEWVAGGASGGSNYNPYTREYTDYRNTRGFVMTYTADGKFVYGLYSSSTVSYSTTVFEQFYAADYEVVGNSIKLKNITHESFSNKKSRGINNVDDFEFQFLIGTDSIAEYLITNFRNDRPLTLDEQLDFRKHK